MDYSVPPLSGPLPAPQPVNPIEAMARILTNMTPPMRQLSPATLLQGVVMQKPDAQHAVVSTPIGVLRLETDIRLPLNARVELYVVPQGPHYYARIRTVNGQPPIHAAPSSTGVPVAENKQPARHAGVTSATNQPLAQEAENFFPTDHRPPSVTPTEAVQVKLSTDAEPLVGTLIKPNPEGIEEIQRQVPRFIATKEHPLPVATAEPTLEPAPLTSPVVPAPVAEEGTIPLPPLEYAKVIFRLVIPEATEPTVTAESSPLKIIRSTEMPPKMELAATVISTPENPNPIAKTLIGLIALPTTVAYPKDTPFTIEIIRLEGQEDTYKPLGPEIDTPRLVQLLSPSPHPSVASLLPAVVSQVIPTPGKDFAATLFRYLIGLGQGDDTAWLTSDVTEAFEEAGLTGSLEMIRQEFHHLQEQRHAATTTPWLRYPLPVFDGTLMQHALLYVRPPSDEEKDRHHTRFIVELNTEFLGDIQCDGFVKRDSLSPVQFNLIIRSSEKLPAIIQTHLQSIFTNAMDITGVKGGLSFQAMHPFPISPASELASSNASISS